MKLAQSLVLLTGASFTILPALANFHITYSVGGLEACPSKHYNCGCLLGGDNSAQLVGKRPHEKVVTLGSHFSIKGGLCGSHRLNFYQQADKTWLFYDAQGLLQGKCHPRRVETTCSGLDIYDKLFCHSDICGQ